MKLFSARCLGALISPKIVLSSFHCTIAKGEKTTCDHSDEKRLAVLGLHFYSLDDLQEYYTIPVVDVRHPNKARLTFNLESHDFAMLILKKPAIFSPKVCPICLPHENANFDGLPAVSAGWGLTGTKYSPVLKMVNLLVSRKKYAHKYVFGTILYHDDGTYHDPCAGDSGMNFFQVTQSILSHFIESYRATKNVTSTAAAV